MIHLITELPPTLKLSKVTGRHNTKAPSILSPNTKQNNAQLALYQMGETNRKIETFENASDRL
jgi:hypothetical protein